MAKNLQIDMENGSIIMSKAFDILKRFSCPFVMPAYS